MRTSSFTTRLLSSGLATAALLSGCGEAATISPELETALIEVVQGDATETITLMGERCPTGDFALDALHVATNSYMGQGEWSSMSVRSENNGATTIVACEALDTNGNGLSDTLVISR